MRLIMALSRKAKKMASGGHLGFSTFLIFQHIAHMMVNIRLYVSNLMPIGPTVQKLLAFWFSIGNTLKVPKIGVLGDFRGENNKIDLSKPQRAHRWLKTRILTYHSSKSVHAFDYRPIPKGQKNGVRRPSWIFNFFDFSAYGTNCDQY